MSIQTMPRVNDIFIPRSNIRNVVPISVAEPLTTFINDNVNNAHKKATTRYTDALTEEKGLITDDLKKTLLAKEANDLYNLQARLDNLKLNGGILQNTFNNSVYSELYENPNYIKSYIETLNNTNEGDKYKSRLGRMINEQMSEAYKRNVDNGVIPNTYNQQHLNNYGIAKRVLTDYANEMRHRLIGMLGNTLNTYSTPINNELQQPINTSTVQPIEDVDSGDFAYLQDINTNKINKIHSSLIDRNTPLNENFRLVSKQDYDTQQNHLTDDEVKLYSRINDVLPKIPFTNYNKMSNVDKLALQEVLNNPNNREMFSLSGFIDANQNNQYDVEDFNTNNPNVFTSNTSSLRNVVNKILKGNISLEDQILNTHGIPKENAKEAKKNISLILDEVSSELNNKISEVKNKDPLFSQAVATSVYSLLNTPYLFNSKDLMHKDTPKNISKVASLLASEDLFLKEKDDKGNVYYTVNKGVLDDISDDLGENSTEAKLFRKLTSNTSNILNGAIANKYTTNYSLNPDYSGFNTINPLIYKLLKTYGDNYSVQLSKNKTKGDRELYEDSLGTFNRNMFGGSLDTPMSILDLEAFKETPLLAKHFPAVNRTPSHFQTGLLEIFNNPKIRSKAEAKEEIQEYLNRWVNNPALKDLEAKVDKDTLNKIIDNTLDNYTEYRKYYYNR